MKAVPVNEHVVSEEFEYLRTSPAYGLLNRLVIPGGRASPPSAAATGGSVPHHDMPATGPPSASYATTKPLPTTPGPSTDEERAMPAIPSPPTDEPGERYSPLVAETLAAVGAPESSECSSAIESEVSAAMLPSAIHALHEQHEVATKAFQESDALTEEQNDVSVAVRNFMAKSKVRSLCEDVPKVTALSSDLTLGDAFSTLVERGLIAAPVVTSDTSPETIGILDAATTLLLYLTTRRMSFMDRFLRTREAATSAMKIGGLLANAVDGPTTPEPFATIDEDQNLLDLAMQLSTPRSTAGRVFPHRTCVIVRGEIAHVLNQSNILKHLHAHINEALGGIKLDPKVIALRAIIPKVWCVFETDNVGSALASLVHHKVSAVAVVNQKHAFVGELSAETLETVDYCTDQQLTYTVRTYMDSCDRPRRAITCSPNIKLRKLIALFAENSTKRVWVVHGKMANPFSAKRLLGVITATSLLRALLGEAPMYEDQLEVVKEKQLKKAAQEKDVFIRTKDRKQVV